MLEQNKKSIGVTLGVGSILTLLYSLDPTSIAKLMSEAANSQIAQAGFFFTLAAWIHAGRVKKEIAANFQLVTDAINNVAVALRQDLSAQSSRIGGLETKVEEGFTKITARVDALEQTKPKG